MTVCSIEAHAFLYRNVVCYLMSLRLRYLCAIDMFEIQCTEHLDKGLSEAKIQVILPEEWFELGLSG